MVTIPKKIPLLPDGTVSIDAWLNHFKTYGPAGQNPLIEKTVRYVQSESQGLTTFYGQSCLEQGLEMADLLLAMQMDTETATAALATGTARLRRHPGPEVLTPTLGESVSHLVHKVLQVDVLDNRDPRGNVQMERWRLAFLAMAGDIRAVLIRLAERICIMRGIRHIHPMERARIAQETMDIHAPLANRLGIGQLKWELEDTAFHFIHPDIYQEIATFIAEKRRDREMRIEKNINLLKETLAKSGINAEIYGRAKHIYSIWLKSQRKQIPYEQIRDYSALRILVDTVDECYSALSIVHDLFHQLPEEFDDYISRPKPNGYRSIHTAVTDADGKVLEIQIRTRKMHEEAEHGVAAHWMYKESRTVEDVHAARIRFLRQMLAWQSDVVREQHMPSKWVDDTVYVFTPAGDIFDLPQGATPLDFAYRIHTGLGHRCRGAKVDGHIVQLTYRLQTGDHIEIITVTKEGPSRDWMNRHAGYLVTSRARAKVAHWFRQQDALNEPVKASAAEKTEKSEKKPLAARPHKKIPVQEAPHENKPPDLQIAGISDLLTRVALCCKPTHSDPIVGYITKGRGISIHRENCSNIQAAALRDRDRILPVSWDKKDSKKS